jgi:DHA2 family methylenomycin A resistance protein-like MFS transporter
MRRPAVALAASSLAYSLILLNTTVVSVALPAIRDDLGTSVSGLQWVVNGYTLVLAALLLSAGALVDRVGARRMMRAGVAIFALASAAAALAPGTSALIAAQVLLGVGAATLVPAALTLLTHAYPDPIRRARAVGVWAAISASAFATGPVLGGLLVDAVGWRLIFALNLPFAAAIALLLWRGVAETTRTARGLDLAGQVTAVVALASLTFALIESRALGWDSRPVLGGIALAVVAAVSFVAVERRGHAPMLPLKLFSSRAFSASTAAGTLVNFAIYGQFFLMSLYFQDIRGLTALETGLAFLPEPLLFALAGVPAGRMVARIGPRWPLAIGGALGAAGAAVLLTAGESTPYGHLMIGLVLFGAGGGAAIPALTAAAVSAAPPAQVGVAAAALNASRQTGGVLGVAILGGMAHAGPAFVSGMHAGLAIAGGALVAVAVFGLAIGVRPRVPAAELETAPAN